MKSHMKRIVTLCLLAVIGIGTVIPSSNASAATGTQSIALPAYDYPTLPNLWPSLDAAGGSNVPFVIINIGAGGGPGDTVNSDYTARIAANTAKGIRSIGYVDTNYQTRDINEVIAEVEQWYALYPGISGISFDRVGLGDAADVCYSAYAYNYAKTRRPTSLVVQKFGSYTAPEYEPYGDIFMNAEMGKTLYDTWALPADGFQDNPANSNRFWHLVHSTDTADYADALAKTRANNAGWVYITDDTMFNPYDTIASYFTTELTDVATLPASSIPNRGITTLPAGCVDIENDTQHLTTPGKVVAVSTLNNQSSIYAAPGQHKIAFSLPTGVTLSETTTQDWACTASECTNDATIAPNASADELQMTFLADCSYTSGSITLTTTTFPASQQTTILPVQPYPDCEDDSPDGSTPPPATGTNSGGGNAAENNSSDEDDALANTGDSWWLQVIAGGLLVGSGVATLALAKRR